MISLLILIIIPTKKYQNPAGNSKIYKQATQNELTLL